MRWTSQAGGFALLFAVLLVSIILTISLSLFSITFKQLLLSSVIRESQIAFYAADSALKCAVHWNSGERGTANPFGYYDANHDFHEPDDLNAEITCNGLIINPQEDDDGQGRFTSTFRLTFDVPDATRQACALVTITKERPRRVPGPEATIDSSGYNLYQAPTNCPSQATDRVVERAWLKTYEQ